MSARFIIGNSLDELRSMPAASVDLVLTSSPFLGLRDYLAADDPAKVDEIGGEATPGAFVDRLLDVAEECARVLAPHGTLAWELGDGFSGSGGAGGDYTEDGLRAGQPVFSGSAKARRNANDYPNRDDAPRRDRNGRGGEDWPLDKSLVLVPELFRLALAYGFNPLTGRRTPRWRVRNVIRWIRTNPPVGDLGDKFRPGTSDIVVACKSGSRYFDLDAVRNGPTERTGEVSGTFRRSTYPGSSGDADSPGKTGPWNAGGAPPLDWWREEHDPGDVVSMTWADYCDLAGLDDEADDVLQISARGYKGAHFATWPASLLVRPIEAMCPRKVCVACGLPSSRLHQDNPEYAGRAGGPTHNNDEQGASLKGFKHKAYGAPARLVAGWSCCGCGDGCRPTTWTTVLVPVAGRKAKTRKVTVVDDPGRCAENHHRAGVVLDPFAGTFTTGAVATGHGRDAIGIDLDARNADLARERLGMFLDVEDHRPALTAGPPGPSPAA